MLRGEDSINEETVFTVKVYRFIMYTGLYVGFSASSNQPMIVFHQAETLQWSGMGYCRYLS
jgi:hypothetical protein